MLICCIHLLFDWCFRLYPHITLFCRVLSILTLIWLVFMALFCAAIRRDSVLLLRLPFLCHVHVFSCEMSRVSRLKRPFLLFFCTLLFSGYLYSADTRFVSIASGSCNQFSSRFYMWSSSCCIDASTLSSMQENPLPPTFLDTYSLSRSSLECKALCMVISLISRSFV